jgi:glycosyltransferase involved in cell wall biosynthesis
VIPEVSVCVTTYQHAPYIAAALEGALAQQAPFPVEILVGEDDSTDGTRDIVAAYERRGAVRAFYRSRRDVVWHRGRPTGRHNFLATLRAARGRYLAFLDGDDLWTDERKLARQVARLQAEPGCAICFHAAALIDERGARVGCYAPARPRPRYRLADLLAWLDFATSSAVIRRDAIPELDDWYRSLPFGDWPLFALAARRGELAYVDEEMSAYRLHPGGRWTAASAELRWRDAARATREVRRRLDAAAREAADERIARVQGRLVATLLRQRRPAAASAATLRAVAECLADRRGLLRWTATIARAALGLDAARDRTRFG